uniref:Genome polyprotein n=1 Tax=Yam mild mosaic virus TaxID=87097 RepID=X2L7U3_9POTV|nr:polyprotein [Yam mild mosaic virus]
MATVAVSTTLPKVTFPPEIEDIGKYGGVHFVFGSFTTEETPMKVTKPIAHIARAMKYERDRAFTKTQLEAYELARQKFEEECDALGFKPHVSDMSRIVKGTNGTKYLKEYSARFKKECEIREKSLREEIDWFKNHEAFIVNEIKSGNSNEKMHTEVEKPKKIFFTRSKKVRQEVRRIHLSQDQMHALISSVIKITPVNCVIELKHKGSPSVLTKQHFKGRRILKVQTQHEKGELKVFDYIENTQAIAPIQLLADTYWRGKPLHERQITRGCSGFIISRAFLNGYYYCTGTHMIVRGRHRNLLCDSASYLPVSYLSEITHYSVAETFWKGFDEGFRTNRHTPQIHEGKNTLPVAEVGKVAGIVCQSLYPCCRITCTECAEKHLQASEVEARNELTQTLRIGAAKIQAEHPDFEHVANSLRKIEHLLSLRNDNREASGKIQFLIGERTEAPFTHILSINECLLKGTKNTSADFSRATDHLLEIARWMRNRTDNIRKGSIESFRNKISGKAHINPSLMCDNQLDSNGNFKWGRRGYHAKRFFSNYFDLIEPEHGYEKFKDRKHPHGVRKLAIGNLILSTNLDVLRTQLEGESIERLPITTQCVSKRHESFVYPCCCVTYDDGTPVYSTVKTPTRNHLVIGTTGDSKYLDLPTEISEKLYIAKEGYCYINIFLAMLVEVDEDEAKDYTKWVRDVIATQLGQWPTISDIALACYQLSVLFPSTRCAELPRILVDHATKTMHVIDSYGSLTTGYHILKAQTVSQLIDFAHDTLESEMKHYKVGGIMNATTVNAETIKLLIRAVYRPKVLKEIIENEPYMLTLCIVSPVIMREMYRNGAFKIALLSQVKCNMNIKLLSSLLENLAMKVTRAQQYNEQMAIINKDVCIIRDVLNNGSMVNHSRNQALRYVETIIATQQMDQSLRHDGYYTTQSLQNSLAEKIYAEELKASWRELTLSEKFSSTYRSLRVCERFGKRYKEGKQETLRNVSKSVTQYLCGGLTKMKTGVRVSTEKCTYKIVSMSLKTVGGAFNILNYITPEFLRTARVVAILSLFLSVFSKLQRIVNDQLHQRALLRDVQLATNWKKIETHYETLTKTLQNTPTIEEFAQYLKESNAELYKEFVDVYKQIPVEHQAKRESEQRLEQIIAFIALVMMIFDNERSDCVYKVLNKLKNLMNTAEPVVHQSLDDIIPIFEREQLIDFELDTHDSTPYVYKSSTFSKWWDNQLQMNHVIPHYRNEGHFMEFTRSGAAGTASEIACSDHKDILLRGAVGSGKSTSLPFLLSKHGHVLLVEPTRPLVENVYTQLRGAPFHASPTMMMRHATSFGSSPITIMTSGFAIHYLANNRSKISSYSYIIFDECHVEDANAMALRCLLDSVAFEGKIIKVSATPPGREVEFSTQYPVELRTEDKLSFEQFVQNLGSGSNSDVTIKGDNILVYVASYNDVDTLARMLVDKHYLVTKVDGRTMKNGLTGIQTHGTAKRKHFVVATNIIENGVTLDIECVVDFGVKVVPELDIDQRRIIYKKVPVSYGERIQRLGRVGRHKAGTALRIGQTIKEVVPLNTIVATEAAFLSFVYGLPVMTAQVSTAILSHCTVQQARTMKQFELPTHFMVDLVCYDGTMHPLIHNVLKQYKLRESEITLNKRAIPHSVVTSWQQVRSYDNDVQLVNMAPSDKIPFLCKDIPGTVYEKLWKVVVEHKNDAGFKNLTSMNAAKIAYKLKTDPQSIPRTIRVIDELIKMEMEKKAHLDTVSSFTCSSSNMSLHSIGLLIQSRYVHDHTAANISTLQAAKAQLKSFPVSTFFEGVQNSFTDRVFVDAIEHNGALETVLHQSKDDILRTLDLKGKWKGSVLARDILITAGVAAGATWMLYEYFTEKLESVTHQGKNKRQKQKLRFREAADRKIGHVVFDDDSGTIEHYFGDAYAKKGKSKGKTIGMGKKTRRFVNMYGFDPAEYQLIRFIDPLTGEILDESPHVDIMLVKDHFDTIRMEKIADDELEPQRVYKNSGIQAYLIKDKVSPVLKIDLTEHLPLAVCNNFETIAGFPEREGELRQTGQAVKVSYTDVPQKLTVTHEGDSLVKGLFDHNNISKAVCKITNASEGFSTTLYGIGFGAMIIANRHLFKRTGGELMVRTTHGEFTCPDVGKLKIHPIENRDMVIIQMPKDFPPFATKLKFRAPRASDKVKIVGTNFQEKYISSLVSGVSAIYPVSNSDFWKHWIKTDFGHCGLPLVSEVDGFIVGIHSLASTQQNHNYFTGMVEHMNDLLMTAEQLEYTKLWTYNPREISWGTLDLQSSTPAEPFKLSKLLMDLEQVPVVEQSLQTWMYSSLEANLKAVGRSQAQLVTKHVVKGECVLFQQYLATHSEAQAFFKPLMGHYGKSRLNKEAYIKDIKKYAQPIVIGTVDTSVFECAVANVKTMLSNLDFGQFEYITDSEVIFKSLNMKAAVGAMYSGKKKDYFEGKTANELEEFLKESCKRLYVGKKGIWNGSIKAELRPMEKVHANKTRTFTAAPIDTLLGAKTCVDDFNNFFYMQHTKGPWSVGMTKFSKGWDKMLKKIPEGWIICDADGSRFDSSLTPYLINAVAHIRQFFNEDWDVGKQMLRNLYTEIVYTPILTADGTIVKKFRGNNSGQPSTVVDNTLMVLLAVQYAMLKNGINDVEQKECVYFANGDDLVIAIPPGKEHVLNTMAESFAELGLSYDFGNRHKRKEDIWFMSHKAIKREGIFIPKLEEERIVAILEWNRTEDYEHRLEAICAAMIEAWGYDELLRQIRLFYSWVLEQEPYRTLASEGRAPYISEYALRRLYLGDDENDTELYNRYLRALVDNYTHDESDVVIHQASKEQTFDAGQFSSKQSQPQGPTSSSEGPGKDVNVGTKGTFSVPRIKTPMSKLTLPKLKGKILVNLEHLVEYEPEQVDLSNKRASQEQLGQWVESVKTAYDVDDEQLKIILNGFMVWCIENGTSPNINGNWYMIENGEQIEFPLKPIVENAKPTLRQIMAHFSDLAEAYIEKRNAKKAYMPGYGLKRNLNDYSLARYAFDFFEITSKTPVRAREAHMQMKAAALRNTRTRLFGLDGSVGTNDENTERHTSDDVNKDMHSLLGVRNI